MVCFKLFWLSILYSSYFNDFLEYILTCFVLYFKLCNSGKIIEFEEEHVLNWLILNFYILVSLLYTNEFQIAYSIWLFMAWISFGIRISFGIFIHIWISFGSHFLIWYPYLNFKTLIWYFMLGSSCVHLVKSIGGVHLVIDLICIFHRIYVVDAYILVSLYVSHLVHLALSFW